jgi:putative ABC transport system permease protein
MLAMIQNYFKVALRAILKNKLTSVINISGLAFAMACCLLIFLFISDELSYDRHISKADRIYRVTREFLSPDGSTTLHLGHVAPPFGPLLKNDFPDFEEVVRTRQNYTLVTRQDNPEAPKAFNERNCFYAEPAFLSMFDVEMVAGNRERALQDPFTLLISETTAKKYFGDEDPQGKRLRFNDQFDFEVTGIFKDFPAQSHLHPALLRSFSTLNDTIVYGRKRLESNFGNNSFATYVLVKDNFEPKQTESLFPAFLDKHMSSNAQSNDPKPSSWTRLYLQKLTDIHLRSHLDSEIESNGDINNVYMMGVIGLFIILIACFNFINLSTARATKRAKEVGLRKVVGAFRIQLITQYLSESVLTTFIALVIGIGLAALSIGWLNDFTEKSLRITLLDWPMTLGLVGVALVVGLLSGVYPALIISGFRPAMVLKGNFGTRGKGGIRKTLVVAQFAISTVLMIATAVTFQQLDFMKTRDLGYDKDQLVIMTEFRELTPVYESFYNELSKSSSIKNVGRSDLIPTNRLVDYDGCRVQQGDSMAVTSVVIKNVTADYEFFNTYGIDLVTGRTFSRDIRTDDSLAFILNEAAVNMLGWPMEEAVGKDFQYGDTKGKVIGVVKDFHFESLHEPIVPVVFFMEKGNYGSISVKIAGSDMQTGIAHIEKVWKTFLPNRPFEYVFLNERYSRLYLKEQKEGQLFTLFSGLAILIACLGLFGLATFNAMQRVKEIGIRKVMGASLAHILTLLSKEIFVLILVANLIAWPVAWYMMAKWLDTFAYRINMSIVLFIIAAVAGLLIALITVSSQTIKTAMTNPAKTLRYE